jgi:hypothetical protein
MKPVSRRKKSRKDSSRKKSRKRAKTTNKPMRRVAAEEATERMFQTFFHERGYKTFEQYLKKNKIPYSRWTKDGIPTSQGIVLTEGDAHAGYYDGTYLWNPNDSSTGIGLEDGFDDLFTDKRGFSDFNGGRKGKSHNSVTRNGWCFLLSLGYYNILKKGPKSEKLDASRERLLSMSTKQVVARKVS